MKRLWLFALLFLPLAGCNGSGAVNPLTPSNASKPETVASSPDSDVLYWTTFPTSFTFSEPLNGICMVNKKMGWACGNNGLVLQYDGQTWSRIQTTFANNENLMGVAFLDENEGWFVGTHGTILHYRNGNWNLETSNSTETLYGIAVNKSRRIWVCGSNGTLLTYNGISWASVIALSAPSAGPATILNDIFSIGLSSQNSGWAVCDQGIILKYDGEKWQSVVSPTTEKLTSVSVLSEVQAWAVGAYGTILSFNGTTWNKMGSAFSGFNLFSIYMRDDSDGWMAGQDGTIAYYDGTRWISSPKPDAKPSLNAIAFYKDLGFMVGQNATILKFQPGGQLSKFDFLFKGEVAQKPEKAKPYWSVTYTFLNQSPKVSPFLNYELPIPKGFEAYRPEGTPVPASAPATLVPTATLVPKTTPNSTPGVSPTGTPSVKSSVRSGGAVGGTWKMKDGNLVWEVGTVAATEMKTLTVMLKKRDQEKADYPVLLKPVLKAVDRVVAEAAPLTLLASEPTPIETAIVTPTPVPTPAKTK
jgi:photosystem II stability/assembly factor-like uncharacterized protein